MTQPQEIQRLHDHQEFKRAVIEARIDELESLFPGYKRDGIGIDYTVYNEWVRKRIAELEKVIKYKEINHGEQI